MLITFLAAFALTQPASQPTEPAVPSAKVPPATPAAPVVMTPTVLWSIELRSDSYGGAAIADADGDGAPDIAFGTYFGDSQIYVLRGKDGSVLWKHDASTVAGVGNACVDASCKFADLDADGKLELVVPISNRCLVLALDGKTGNVKWDYDAGSPECIDTPPAIVATTKDGGLDVVVGTFGGNLHVIKASDGTRRRVLSVAPKGKAVQSCPLVVDLNGDGVLDFLSGDWNGPQAVRATNGVDGSESWSIPLGKNIYHGPSMGDIDGDGKPEFAIGCYDGSVTCFEQNGKVRWKVKPGDHYFMSPTVMVDVDGGDGKDEVVAASTHLTVLRADGTVVYRVPITQSVMSSVTRGVAAADLDGDGGVDFVCEDSAGVVRVFRGRDGALFAKFDAASVMGKSAEHSSHGPVIADLDGDGRLDVFFVAGSGKEGSRFGRAIALTGFEGRGKGWPMFRHDVRNMGNARTGQAAGNAK